MAHISKNYLDLEGLQYLLNKLNSENRIVKHTGGHTKAEGAYKISVDAYGHVTAGDAIAVGDIPNAAAKSDIGNGKLTLKIGNKTVEFAANQATNDNETFEITTSDLSGLGLDGAMHFKGVVTTLPAVTNYASGDVILVKDTSSANEAIKAGVEYVCANGDWHELGSEGSHALKTVKVEGDGTYITGSGTLAGDIKLSHSEYKNSKLLGAYKVAVDSAGHISNSETLSIKSAGSHTHTASVTIPGSTYGSSVSPSSTKLSVSKTAGTTDTVVKSYPGEFSKLVTTSITGVSGSTIASKATAGTAVVYGQADVGTQVTGLAKRGSQINYGMADRAATPTTVVTGLGGTAYAASYADECLSFTALNPVTKGIYEAVDCDEGRTTYGCTSDQVSVLPAKAADTTRKITPYIFSDVTVPKAATATTVATGALNSTATGGSLMVGLGEAVSAEVIKTESTYKVASGANGDVSVVTGVTLNKEAAKTISVTVESDGAHAHEFN